MSMISELTKELRMWANVIAPKQAGNLLKTAADTIEELSAKLAAANMERSTDYYNGGWIPCSEREPEDPCVYTVEDCSPYTVKKFGAPQRYVWKVLPHSLEMHQRLVAWKPIDPEPYKGE